MKNGCRVLTHCSAGWLALVDWASAPAPIYPAQRKGRKVFVWVDDTRPRNQGAALAGGALHLPAPARLFPVGKLLGVCGPVFVPAFCRRGQRIYLIQDNASYHKKRETSDWFARHRRNIGVFPLPPYWPELNATERIWNYTGKPATHNRFIEGPRPLCRALLRTFEHVQQPTGEIQNLIRPVF